MVASVLSSCAEVGRGAILEGTEQRIFEEAMVSAARYGHIDVVKLCRGWFGVRFWFIMTY